MSKDENKNIQQRALVLQGGGALGAYEAGVFNVLCNWIKKDIKEEDGDKNIFHTIAGTSIGAINAAILVGYVREKGDWEGASEQLLKFWKHISSSPILSRWLSEYYNYYNTPTATSNKTNIVASKEALRRYYSAKEFIYTGAQNVFRSPTTHYDFKFYDNVSVPVNNIWVTYDNTPLRESIRNYTKFPIATSFDEDDVNKQQPRLLLVSVDAEEGEAVTFDSYEKEGGSRKSEYGYDEGSSSSSDTDPDYCARDVSNDQQRERGYKDIIRYDQGIMVEHVMASASVPEHYDYTLVPKVYDYTRTEEEKLKEMKYYGNSAKSEVYRRFWDGGVLSNTPFRELIQSHKDYWLLVKGKEKENAIIPNLDIYIVDVWPSIDKYPLPFDLDGIRDRKNDLTYMDKTPYEEKVANLISDYYNLSKELINLANDKKIPEPDIQKILNIKAKSKTRTGEDRFYRQLLFDQFDITRVIRIERCPDPDDISNKWCEFSSETVERLIRQGMSDTLGKLVNDEKKVYSKDQISDHLIAFINEVNKSPVKTEYDSELIDSAQEIMIKLN